MDFKTTGEFSDYFAAIMTYAELDPPKREDFEGERAYRRALREEVTYKLPDNVYLGNCGPVFGYGRTRQEAWEDLRGNVEFLTLLGLCDGKGVPGFWWHDGTKWVVAHLRIRCQEPVDGKFVQVIKNPITEIHGWDRIPENLRKRSLRPRKRKQAIAEIASEMAAMLIETVDKAAS